MPATPPVPRPSTRPYGLAGWTARPSSSRAGPIRMSGTASTTRPSISPCPRPAARPAWNSSSSTAPIPPSRTGMATRPSMSRSRSGIRLSSWTGSSRRGRRPMPPTRQGDTALHLALRSGRFEYIPALLAKGADIFLANGKSETPLSVAIALSNGAPAPRPSRIIRGCRAAGQGRSQRRPFGPPHARHGRLEG